MDYYSEYENMKIGRNSNPTNKSYFLEKITQILFSISVFTILIFYVFFCTKIFTSASEINYMFILFNGILVLIISIPGVVTKIVPVETSLSLGSTVLVDDNYIFELHEVEISAKVAEKNGDATHDYNDDELKNKGGNGDGHDHGHVDDDEVGGEEDHQEWEEQQEQMIKDGELKNKGGGNGDGHGKDDDDDVKEDHQEWEEQQELGIDVVVDDDDDDDGELEKKCDDFIKKSNFEARSSWSMSISD